MGRHNKAIGKTQREKKFTRRNAPKAARRRTPASLEDQLDRRTRELKEALEQQAATSEVLQIINASPGDVAPVFEAILEKAHSHCGAALGSLGLVEGETWRAVVTHGYPAPLSEKLRHGTRISDNPILRPLLDGANIVQFTDQAKIDHPIARANIKFGIRTLLLVPLRKDGALVGTISAARRDFRPFTGRQIALLENFAAQAVIAIENVRLFEAEHRRSRELSEALDQQTATSEVLSVISSSPGDLEPVFKAMLENATRLCEARYGTMWLREGDAFRAVSLHGPLPSAYIDLLRGGTLFRPGADTPTGRVAQTRQPVQVLDLRETRAYLDREPVLVSAVEVAGIRTMFSVPMLKKNQLVGTISIYRQEVRPFTEKQIELVQNFAAQAVIAVENTRLLRELRESLQEQTATTDVLKVISRSTFDLQAVLSTLVESACRLCDAEGSAIWRPEGDEFKLAANFGHSGTHLTAMRQLSIRPGRETCAGRVLLEKQTVHIPDCKADQEYRAGDTLKAGGNRAMLGVPLLREGLPVGVFTLIRTTARPFTEKQIELAESFADQAVIAIENTRLLNELRQRTDDLSEALEQQTATSEVLQVISSSPGELEPVFQTMLENATRICNAKFGNLYRREGDAYQLVSTHGLSPAIAEDLRRAGPRRPPPNTTALGRVIATKRTAHIADALNELGDLNPPPGFTGPSLVKLAGARTVLGVPMLKQDELVGAIVVYRTEVRPFTDKQIDLISNFAAQAVIAIENVRLFKELRSRTHELTLSLNNLRNTQDRLVQTQKLALLGQLTAGIAHEIKNPLNFVNNFSGISAELITELQVALEDVTLDDKRRGEITELMDTLRSNLDKVVQHGKRADAIVKNMLLHSREGSGEHRLVDINVIVEESINLAWHGARAEKKNSDIALERSFDPTAGEVDLFPQDITRALLNLISNGFYAVTKRKAETNGGEYVPTLTASTKSLGDRVEIRIRDNGTGIPPEVKVKMFNPFFTTKPTGEGTGLGLSISHDIIVKQHAGSIEVDTQPGEFTEIRVILPRVAALLPERS